MKYLKVLNILNKLFAIPFALFAAAWLYSLNLIRRKSCDCFCFERGLVTGASSTASSSKANDVS